LGRSKRDPEYLWLRIRKSLRELSRLKEDGSLTAEIYLFVKFVDESLGIDYKTDFNKGSKN